MKSINFDTGEKKYAINGDENNVISINIKNPNLLANIEHIGERIAEISEKYENIETPEELAKYDKEIKKYIDELYCADISSHLFGAKSCFSLVGEEGSEEFIFVGALNAFNELLSEEIGKSKTSLSAEEQGKSTVDSYIDNAIKIDAEYAEFLKWKEQNK